MPQDTIQLTVAVPDHQVLDTEVAWVQFPLTTGYIGILPGHAPLLSEVGTGVLTYAVPGASEKYLAIDSGAVEVLPDTVRILAGSAEHSDEIDEDRAREALERADERLQLSSYEIEVDRAQRAIERAQARIGALKRA